MHRPVPTTFSSHDGCAASDRSAEPSRSADIAADPRDEIEHHLPALRAIALLLFGTRAPADEIVAHTVVAAWANIDAYDRGTRLRAWMFRMPRPVSFGQRHPSGRRARSDTGGRLDVTTRRLPPVAGPADPRCRRSFGALAAEQHEALILIGPAELSLDEAASVCRCTPAMVRHGAKFGRRKLATLVPPESRETNRENTGVGQAPHETAGPCLPAGPPGVPHRTRLGPPDGRGRTRIAPGDPEPPSRCAQMNDAAQPAPDAGPRAPAPCHDPRR